MRILTFLIAFLIISFSGFAKTTLKDINFRQKGEVSLVEFIFDNNKVEANKFQLIEDKQIILDFKDVSPIDSKVLRPFDTSEFSGSIVLVSPYIKPSSKKDLRVAIQLRDNVRSILKRDINKVTLEVENRFGVFKGHKVVSDIKPQNIKSNTKKSNLGEKINIPKSLELVDILENLTLSGKKRYVGKKISLNVKNIPVSKLLRIISEISGFSIIVMPEVNNKPPLTLRLINMPWDQVLDIILNLNKLVAQRSNVILTIKTIEQVTKERKEILESENLKKKQEPLLTKVFPISYTTTKDLEVILKDYLSKDRGKITADVRTNSLIIIDTEEVLEKIKKIVDVLDTQTPQILIESKIVEISEDHKEEIGIGGSETGITFGYDPISPQFDSDGVPLQNKGPGFAFSTSPKSGDVLKFKVAKLGRLFDLDFNLRLLESDSKAKVVSNPRIVTQNKKKASFNSRKTDYYKTIDEEDSSSDSESSDASDSVTYEEATANLAFDVTPQVTNEGSIILDISVSKEDFGARAFGSGPPTKTSSSVKTSVLIENGSTIIVGGLYEYNTSQGHSGIPFLKDLPIIGWLFRTPYKDGINKREIMIFLLLQRF